MDNGRINIQYADMKNEIWKQVSGYDNYEVSNYGRIRNKTTKKVLKNVIQPSGYTVVSLRKDSKTKTHAIHRLIMETFRPIDNPRKYDVMHIDKNNTNNNLDNLKWINRTETILENMNNSTLKKLETIICQQVKILINDWYKEILENK